MNSRIKIIDFPFNSGATIGTVYFQQLVALRTMSLYSTAQRVLSDVGLRGLRRRIPCFATIASACRVVPRMESSPRAEYRSHNNGEATEDSFRFCRLVSKGSTRPIVVCPFNLRTAMLLRVSLRRFCLISGRTTFL